MGLRTLFTKIKSWIRRTWRKLTSIVVAVGTTIGAVFLFLASIGAITILGHSGDVMCAGTIDDPCYTYINFTANKDFWIDMGDHTPYGLTDTFEFVPDVQSWKIQHSWLSGWKDFSDSMVYFERGVDYQVRIVSYKVNPYDHVEWSAFDGLVGADLLADTNPSTYKKTMLWEGENQTLYPFDMLVDLKEGKIYSGKDLNMTSTGGYEFKYKEGDISKGKLHHLEIFKDKILYWVVDTNCTLMQNDDVRTTLKWSVPEGGKCVDYIEGKGNLVIMDDGKICEDNLKLIGEGLIKDKNYEECLSYPLNYMNTTTPLNDSQNWSIRQTTSYSLDKTKATVEYFTPFDPILTDYYGVLLSCYTFDSNLSDSYTDEFYDNDDVVVNTSSKVGNGSSWYDGITSYGEITSSTFSVMRAVDSHTTCGWFNQYTTDGEQGAWDMRSSSTGYQLRLEGKRVRWVGKDDAGEYQHLHNETYSPGVWNFMCIGYYHNLTGDNTFMSYVNGVQYFTFAADNYSTNPDGNIRFGDVTTVAVPSAYNFGGGLDEWVFFNRLLNKTEMDELYNNTAGVSCEEIIAGINNPPTTPTNITREGTTNLTGTFSGTQSMQCNGSIDEESDTITYLIEKVTNTTVEGFIPLETYITSATGNDTIYFSAENCGNECAYKLFDQNTGTKWLAFFNTGWINIKLGNGAKRSLAYKITSANDASDRDPDDWTISGSNDNTSWDLLDVKIDQEFVFAGRGQTYEFNMSQPTNESYLYYKWNITEIRTPSANILQVAELWLKELDFNFSSVANYTTLGNHTQDNSYSWNLDDEVEGTNYTQFRCRSVDLAGSGRYSGYYTVNSYFTIGASSADTCTYTSGNWAILCSDTCSITTAVAIDSGNNITITGTGTFSTTKNITGWTNLRIAGTDSSNRCVVTCSAGGCFNQ